MPLAGLTAGAAPCEGDERRGFEAAPSLSANASANAIEIRVEEIAQLFHTLDPFPFHEKDLDREAEDYIVGWARELPRGHPIHIVVHLPGSEARGPLAQQLPEAIARNFIYRSESAGLELKELFRVGRMSLLIGFTVLAGCVVANQLLAESLGAGHLARFFSEGLIILGWVANWRPIQIFLYDWWPIARRRNLYRRLAAAEVELRAYERSTPPVS